MSKSLQPKTKRSLKRRLVLSVVAFMPLMTFGGFAWALPTYDHLSSTSTGYSSLRMSGKYAGTSCGSIGAAYHCDGLYTPGSELDAGYRHQSYSSALSKDSRRSLKLNSLDEDTSKTNTWKHAEKYLADGDIVISIIIDDLGWSGKYGRKATELPGPVAMAVLPHTRHAKRLAERAHRNNKEVMLHQPFQPVSRQQEKMMGKGGITTRMSRKQTVATLLKNIRSIPHVSGLNNHMGSQLTKSSERMSWVMEALHNSEHSLFYVDSVTTSKSQGSKQARRNAIPTTDRDIFLDHRRSVSAVRKQFRRLIRKAKINGSAVAIGHPYPETMRVLQEELQRLDKHNVRLVPVREMIVYRQLVAAAKKQSLAYSKY